MIIFQSLTNEIKETKSTARKTLICQDLEGLIKSLKCYWAIDYMFRKHSVEELTVENVVIDLKDNEASDSVKRFVVPRAMQQPAKDSGMGTISWKYYNFHSPKSYVNLKGMKATYQNSLEQNPKLMTQTKPNFEIIVKPATPLDYLCKMPSTESDLRVLAEFTVLNRIQT